MAKEIWIESFKDFDDAITWAERIVYELDLTIRDDVRLEIVLIDSSWRVGVETNSRQAVLKLEGGK